MVALYALAKFDGNDLDQLLHKNVELGILRENFRNCLEGGPIRSISSFHANTQSNLAWDFCSPD